MKFSTKIYSRRYLSKFDKNLENKMHRFAPLYKPLLLNIITCNYIYLFDFRYTFSIQHFSYYVHKTHMLYTMNKSFMFWSMSINNQRWSEFNYFEFKWISSLTFISSIMWKNLVKMPSVASYSGRDRNEMSPPLYCCYQGCI